MKITLTGATGLIGRELVAVLKERGDEITVLSRDPERARRALDVEAARWDPLQGPAPTEALEGRDAVVHLAGEPVAQRWNAERKRAIRASREQGTRNLVDAIRVTDAPPAALICSNAVGYYGKRGDETIDVVLLDLVMPGLSGMETLERLMERRPDLAVIVLTATGGIDTVVQAMRAGADDFLTKPISQPELLVRVRSLLRIKSLHDQLGEWNRTLEQRVQARFLGSGKALGEGEPDGYAQVVMDASTGLLLGATIMGVHAVEMIHEIGVAISDGLTVTELGEIIHLEAVGPSVVAPTHERPQARHQHRERERFGQEVVGPGVEHRAARERQDLHGEGLRGCVRTTRAAHRRAAAHRRGAARGIPGNKQGPTRAVACAAPGDRQLDVRPHRRERPLAPAAGLGCAGATPDVKGSSMSLSASLSSARGM